MRKRISKYLLRVDNYRENCIFHYCPACDDLHPFAVDSPFPNGHQWTFNNNLEKPTFSPSMNCSIGPYPEGTKRAGEIDRCHYHLKEGKIQYLGDCTHDYKGKTINLPEIPERYYDE